MFKKEIKFIYDFNVNEVKKLGNFVTYEQLLSANIHPAILQYISADIDYLIFEDRQKILSNSIFDYSGEKIQQHFVLVGDEIKRTKRFSLDYMSKLVLHASSFTVNFLARPRWALTKFIFDDENHKNTTEIKQILNYLYYYGYIRRIIVSYINRKKILSINEEEFTELINKIDNLAVESNQRTIVQNSLKSMVDFFSIGDNSGRGIIPFKTVEHFLEEKKLPAYLDKFRKSFNSEDKQIGFSEYIKAFEEVLSSKTEEVDDTALKTGLREEVESEEVIEAKEDLLEGLETEEGMIEESGELDAEESDSEEEPGMVEESEEDLVIAQKVELEVDEPMFVSEEGAVVDEIEDKAFQLLDAETNLDFDEPEIPVMNFEDAQLDSDLDVVDKTDETGLVEEDNRDDVEIDKQTEPGNENLGLFDELEEELEETDNEKEIDKVLNDLVEENKMADDYLNAELIDESSGKNIEDQSGDNVLDADKVEYDSSNSSIDISDLLENRNLTNVIEVIFDYDMEDFAHTIETACKMQNYDEAVLSLNKVFETNHVDSNSKEAEALKSVVLDYFNKMD